MIAEPVRQNRDFTTESTENTEMKEEALGAPRGRRRTKVEFGGVSPSCPCCGDEETAHSQKSLCHG
jgi:hypothetical protein